MKALRLLSRTIRAGVAVALAVAVAALPEHAAGQYYPPLTFYDNGLIIKVPQLRLFAGGPAVSGYPGQQVVPGPNCLLDQQMRLFLHESGFYDVSFFGYASIRAHAIAVRGPVIYRLIIHRCTHEILSAVPVGRI